MTGMKIPIVILSRLGNSITYDTALEIETAQAELSQQFDSNRFSLPIQPKDPSSTAPTVFWFDNFDSFVDNNTGAGSIHNTPGVAFQEETSATMRRPDASIQKSKKRSLSDLEEAPATKIPKINPKKNPKHILIITNLLVIEYRGPVSYRGVKNTSFVYGFPSGPTLFCSIFSSAMRRDHDVILLSILPK